MLSSVDYYLIMIPTRVVPRQNNTSIHNKLFNENIVLIALYKILVFFNLQFQGVQEVFEHITINTLLIYASVSVVGTYGVGDVGT